MGTTARLFAFGIGCFGSRAVLLATLVAACAHPEPIGKKVTIAPENLRCERDSDCFVSNRDPDSTCCDMCPVQPYAISRYGQLTRDRDCGDVMCSLSRCIVQGIDQPRDFEAVCIRHACTRRRK
jgi:hypothetical protein